MTLSQWDRRIGGFARMLPRDSSEELARALATAGLFQVQLNLSALDLPTIPKGQALADLDLASISETFASHELTLWGLSATYNMAHPDASLRREATRNTAAYLRAMPEGIATAATLCTGSRDAENQWRAHPDNRTEAAWRDFRTELDVLLEAVPDQGPLLGIEPEPGNVVSDADAALRLLDELGADASRVGIILDPANLVAEHPLSDHSRVLEDAFAQLGEHTVCIHIKDTVPWADTLARQGVVDYASVISLTSDLPAAGAGHGAVPLVIQDATESQVPGVLSVLRTAIDTLDGRQ